MGKKEYDDIIDLRGDENEKAPEFKIEEEEDLDEQQQQVILSGVDINPHSKVKVKFDKFVNLIANHAYEEIFERHREDDIIIETDLLTDLANAHEEKSDKKVPFLFIGGILLGAILMWVITKM